MSEYTPNARPHRVLERQAERDCDFAAVAELMAGGTMASKRRKAWHLLANMLSDRVISGGKSRYFITQDGRDVLEGLRAGSHVPVANGAPTIRVF